MPDLGKIDFQNMTDEQRFVLGQLLIAYKSEKAFPPGKYTLTLHDEENKDTTFTFELTDIILHRVRAHHPSEDRFEIIDSHMMAEGGFGRVLPIKGTLAPLQDGSVILKEKERVVKQQTKLKKVVVQQEFEMMAKTPHLHPKPPTFVEPKLSAAASELPTVVDVTMPEMTTADFGNYIIMRFLKGKDLLGIIEDDLASLTVDQRLELSIRLLRALQTQVHDAHLVHRDLKPPNILVDLESDPIAVAICDYGTSKNEGEITSENVGTRQFQSPEQLLYGRGYKDQTTDASSDRYAMGLIIGLIWGIPNPPEEGPLAELTELTFDFSALDKLAPQELSVSHGKQIQSLISDLTKLEKDRRCSSQDTIDRLEQIKLERKLTTINPEYHDEVKKAQNAAKAARQELKKLANEQPQDSFKEIESAITRHLEKFSTGNDAAFKEFIDTFEVSAFKNLKTPAEIMMTISHIAENLTNNTAKLHKLRQEFETLASVYQSDPPLKQEAESLVKAVDTVLGKYQKYKTNIDDMNALNQRFNKAIDELTPKIEFITLKSVLKNAIKKYKENISNLTLFPQQQEDIKTLLRIIHQASSLDKLRDTLAEKKASLDKRLADCIDQTMQVHAQTWQAKKQST